MFEIPPKFVSFDMNGTLIHYRQDETIRKVLGERLRAEIVDDFYDQIPTWTPYPGVTAALTRLAESYPLVILTNTDDVHAPSLVENLQVPVEAVITAEQAQAYKPRLRAFEYLLATLGAAPDEIVHVSASPQYDHRPAFDVGIKNKVYLDRGWEPDQPWLSYTRITDIAELPVLFGLERP